MGTTLTATSGTLVIAGGQTLSVAGGGSFGADGHYGLVVEGPGTLATSGTVSVVSQSGNDYDDLYVGDGATWTNNGTVNDAGVIDFGVKANDTGVFVNKAGATFNITADRGTIIAHTTGDTGTFTNAGTLAKTGGTGTSVIAATVIDTGVISAATGTLQFNGGGTFAGTLGGAGSIAFGGGSATLSTSGGNVAVNGGTVVLAGATLASLAESSSGTTSVTSSSSVTGAFSATSGTLVIAGGQTLSVAGGGSFGADGHYGLVVEGPGTLATSGTVSVVSQSGNDYDDLYVGDGATWTNNGTVNDAGVIDFGIKANDTGVFVNRAGATFNITADRGTIIAHTTGDTGTFTNAGTLAKTGGTGTSVIAATVIDTGVISAATGTLQFNGGGTFAGTLGGAGSIAFGGGSATLSTSGGNVAVNGGTVVLAGATLASLAESSSGTTSVTSSSSVTGAFSATSGTLVIAGGQTLSVAGGGSFGADGHYGLVVEGPGTLATSGTVSVVSQSGNDYDDLYVGDGATWTNNGTVNDAGVIDFGVKANDTGVFVNKAGATFNITADRGTIIAHTTGDTGTFTNAGTLAKTGGTGTSVIAATVIDTGVISAATGTLQFNGGGTFAGTLGGAGSIAFGGGSATLSTSGGNVAVNGGTVVLAGATLASLAESSSGTTSVTSSSSVTGAFSATSGTLVIAGGQTLSVAGGGSFGADGHYGLVVEGPGTLATSGTVSVVSQSGNDYDDLYVGDGATWTNNGTINDAGVIDFGIKANDTGVFVNKAGATFNITADRGTIIAHTTGDTGTFTNAGTLAKTGGTGTSVIAASITNTGVISVKSGSLGLTGGLTNLVGTKVSGGTYTVSSGAILQLANNVTIATDGANIALSATGTIQSLNTATNTQVTIDATLTTISSSGALHLTATRNFTAVANSGNFIDNGLLDIGGGTVTATSIALSGVGTISGFGTVKAKVTGAGTVRAVGGTLDLTGASLALLSGGTLSAGSTARADAASTLQLADNQTIVTDKGTITLSGSGSVVQSLNTATSQQVAVDATLASVAAGGVLNLLAGRSFTATANAGSFTDAGGVAIAGGTFAATKVGVSAGGTLTGFGSVQGAIEDDGTINASGGALALKGVVTGAGVLSAATGATIQLLRGGSLSQSISGAGTLELVGGTPYTLAATLGIATVKIDPGATLSGTGVIQGNLLDDGGVTASGGTLTVAGAIGRAGSLGAAAGSVLDLTGGGSFAGALTGAGTIKLDAALTLTAGASLAATTVQENARLTLDSGVSLTNAAGKSYTFGATSGAVVLDGAGSFTNAGTMTKAGAAEADIRTTFINSGTVSVGSGKMAFLDSVGGTGTIDIAGATVAALLDGAAATQTVAFQASSGVLELGAPASFLGTISGFGGSDRIQLLTTPATSLAFAGGDLAVDNGSTRVATLGLSGSYATSNFVLASDGHGGSLITYQA